MTNNAIALDLELADGNPLSTEQETALANAVNNFIGASFVPATGVLTFIQQDGTVVTITIPDADTIVSVVNSLTSTSVTEALSAKQGKLLKGLIDTLAQAYNAHVAATNNPHGTTALHIGLDKVDNTADLNKPVSTLTQEALDDKVDKVVGKGLSANDFTDTNKSHLESLIADATVFNSSNTLNTESNKYTKIASVILTTRYTEVTSVLDAVFGSHGLESMDYIRLHIRVKQQDALGSPPFVTVYTTGAIKSVEFNIGYVITNPADNSSVCEIYVSTNLSFSRLFMRESLHLSDITLYSNQVFLASSPVGILSAKQYYTQLPSNTANNALVVYDASTGNLKESTLNLSSVLPSTATVRDKPLADDASVPTEKAVRDAIIDEHTYIESDLKITGKWMLKILDFTPTAGYGYGTAMLYVTTRFSAGIVTFNINTNASKDVTDINHSPISASHSNYIVGYMYKQDAVSKVVSVYAVGVSPYVRYTYKLEPTAGENYSIITPTLNTLETIDTTLTPMFVNNNLNKSYRLDFVTNQADRWLNVCRVKMVVDATRANIIVRGVVGYGAASVGGRPWTAIIDLVSSYASSVNSQGTDIVLNGSLDLKHTSATDPLIECKVAKVGDKQYDVYLLVPSFSGFITFENSTPNIGINKNGGLNAIGDIPVNHFDVTKKIGLGDKVNIGPYSNDNAALSIAPNGTQSTILLDRIGGQSSIKGVQHLILDSSASFTGINWYSGQPVSLAQGGGNVSVGRYTAPAFFNIISDNAKGHNSTRVTSISGAFSYTPRSQDLYLANEIENIPSSEVSISLSPGRTTVSTAINMCKITAWREGAFATGYAVQLRDSAGVLKDVLTIASTGDTTIAGDLVVNGSVSEEAYYLPPTTASVDKWVRLGVATIAQNGNICRIRYMSPNGYNAAPRQYYEVDITFSTANNVSNDNGFYGWSTYNVTGSNIDGNLAVKVKQINNSTYEFFIKATSFSGNHTYKITSITGTWSHIGQLVVLADITGTIQDSAYSNNFLGGNVGIDTNNPITTLQVEDTIYLTDSTIGLSARRNKTTGGDVNVSNGSIIDGQDGFSVKSTVGGGLVETFKIDNVEGIPTSKALATKSTYTHRYISAMSSSISGPLGGKYTIKLPVATYRQATMLKITINLYSYNGSSRGESGSLDIYYYNYTTGAIYNYAANTSADFLPFDKVVIGDDGVNQYIILGDTDYSVQHVSMDLDISCHWAGRNAGWGTGYALTVASSVPNLTVQRVIELASPRTRAVVNATYRHMESALLLELGDITYNTFHELKWSGNLMSAGMGKSPTVNGYVRFTVPAIGTVIPILGDAVGATATVTANGIAMGTWRTLYYKMTSASSISDDNNWVLVYHAANAVIPTNWVRVAHTNHTQSSVIICSKEIFGGEKFVLDTAWTPITLLNGWVNFGGNYPTARWRCINNVIYLDGLIKLGTFTAGTIIGTLPLSHRPAYRSIVTSINSASFFRLDLDPNGNIYLYDTGAAVLAGGYLSISATFHIN